MNVHLSLLIHSTGWLQNIFGNFGELVPVSLADRDGQVPEDSQGYPGGGAHLVLGDFNGQPRDAAVRMLPGAGRSMTIKRGGLKMTTRFRREEGSLKAPDRELAVDPETLAARGWLSIRNSPPTLTHTTETKWLLLFLCIYVFIN